MVRRDQNTAGNRDGGTDGNEPALAAYVQKRLPAKGGAFAHKQAQRVLSGEKNKGDQKKIREYPQGHNQCLHAFKAFEKHQISHQREKGTGKPGGELCSKGAHDSHVQQRQQQHHQKHPNAVGTETPGGLIR